MKDIHVFNVQYNICICNNNNGLACTVIMLRWQERPNAINQMKQKKLIYVLNIKAVYTRI